MTLRIKHVELKEANLFVEGLHRHHKRVTGHRFSIGVENNDMLVGVAIVGRPVARAVDYTTTTEVLRLCTDGTKNACSILYAACARASKELGYEKIQTYILQREPGTSLLASGWSLEAILNRGANESWSTVKRLRQDSHPLEPKQRWAKVLD